MTINAEPPYAAPCFSKGVRELLLTVVFDLCGLGYQQIVGRFFESRFASIEEYLDDTGRVRGVDARQRLRQAMGVAVVEAEFPEGPFAVRSDPNDAAARALLLGMPEPDLRLAIESAIELGSDLGIAAPRITAICNACGAPWKFTQRGFEWVGTGAV